MKRKTDPALAVAYLRVSTDAERQAHGLDVQRRAIEAFCEAKGLRVLRWCQDELSGRTEGSKRPGFQDALDVLIRERAGVLVVHRIDRLARDSAEGATMERGLRGYGVQLVTVEGGGGDDPAGRLVRSVQLAVAEFEVALIRARIKAARASMRARGLFEGGSAPYGYAVGPEKQIIEEPQEQAQIAQMMELRGRGLSFRAIEARLRKEGLRNRAGSHWHHSSIARLVERHKAS